MQKNLLSMTNFAIVLATILLIGMPTKASAQELPKAIVSLDKPGKLITLDQPGVYGVTTGKPLNTLLVPVNPEERWNVLYQQDSPALLMSGIQFDSTLHVYVTQPDTTIVAPISLIAQATEASESAQVKGEAIDLEKTIQSASASAAITINKFGPTEPEATGAALPAATPKPVAPKPVTLEPSALDGLFEKYGAEYGLSPTVLKHIAKCESGLRPEALSSNGLYGGLFQFVSGTWSSNRKAMGLDPDPALRFNAEEAIKTAAFKISRDGIGAWPVCGRKATAATVASI